MLKIFNCIFRKVCKNWLVTFVHRTLDIAKWKCETQSARHSKHVNSNREKDIMCTCNVMSSISCCSYSWEKEPFLTDSS